MSMCGEHSGLVAKTAENEANIHNLGKWVGKIDESIIKIKDDVKNSNKTTNIIVGGIGAVTFIIQFGIGFFVVLK